MSFWHFFNVPNVQNRWWNDILLQATDKVFRLLMTCSFRIRFFNNSVEESTTKCFQTACQILYTFFHKNTYILVEAGCAYFSEDFQPQMFLLTFLKRKARKNYLTRAIVYFTRKKKHFKVFLWEIWKKSFIGPIFYLKAYTSRKLWCLNNQTFDFFDLRLTLFLRCSYKRGSDKKKNVYRICNP